MGGCPPFPPFPRPPFPHCAEKALDALAPPPRDRRAGRLRVADFLNGDLKDRLSVLCADITSDYVSEILKEGEKAVKQQDDDAEEDCKRAGK